MARSVGMTPEEYVARVKELVADRAYDEAAEFASRHAEHFEGHLSLEQYGLVGSLVKQAILVGQVTEAPRAPAQVQR